MQMIEQTSFTMSDVDTYEQTAQAVERTYNALRLDSLNSMLDTDFSSFPIKETPYDIFKPVDCYLDHDMKQEATAESSLGNEDETAEDMSPVKAIEIEQSMSEVDDFTLISIVVESLSIKDNSDLSLKLPLVSRDGIKGFEIRAIVDQAMWVLNLDPTVGIHAEYYSVSLKQFVNVEEVESQLVSKHDLTNVEQWQTIALRFYNLTGSRIDFSCNRILTEGDIASSYVTMSVDNEFKHSRSRTIGQINAMVHRWRNIASGYFDNSVQRFVKPMSLQ